MSLSQLQQAVWHRRGAQGGPPEARQHGREVVAPVEAVLELGEVARHVLLPDGAVGAGDRRLDVAEGGVDPAEGRRARRSSPGAGPDHLVAAAGLGDGPEAGEAVADHLAARAEAALGEARDGAAAETAHPPQLQADRLALRRGLDRGDEGRLARRAAAALAARAPAAEVGVVQLDATDQ